MMGWVGSVKAVPGRWWFLIAVVALYGAIGLVDAQMARAGGVAFLSLAARVIPALAVVYGLILVFNVFVDPKRVTRYVGHGSGLTGWGMAIGAGVLALGPIYPWYALLGEMKKQGMRTSLVSAFLYARAVKPPLLPLLVHYFGAVFTLVLVGYMLVFAVINGVAAARLSGRRTPDSAFDGPARFGVKQDQGDDT